ncbi:hypothetical protein Q9S78_04575 [Microbacterium sp. KSW-18]|uniref:Uncharacterized protein n=1 Tax=Microbacterium aquilitoris TaxID=3067307 RepID=A0ABU3GGW2_9MICO|nr:hypothetical protein [Microbacterium sp. KSW-18]MDT3329938.1 hypothetical protein [Microbacterium sp. KSW-18]
MTRLEVEVGGWEHDCCGPELVRFTPVEWTVIPVVDGPFVETHHGLEESEGLKVIEVAGTIVELEAIDRDGSRIPITRIPSGRALLGMDEEDAGDVIEMYTDRIVNVSDDDFIVTVDVQD